MASRNNNLKYRYGITEEIYNEMLDKQDYSCAICNQKSEKNLSVDHCHTTGKIRGLLCQNCNVGLGYFNDDKNRMKLAMRYLDQSHST